MSADRTSNLTPILTTAKKINSSFVLRLLRLTLLAPDVVEAILDGRQAPEITLPVLMGAFPREWGEQSEWCQRRT